MPQDSSSSVVALGALTRTDFVKFAGAGGDFNPMHHDDEHARAAGFPSVFAMGMLTAGLASKVVTDVAGLAAVRGLEVRFRAMVWPDEPLFANTAWSNSAADMTGGRQLTFEIVNEAGEVKLSGVAEVAGS